MKDYFKPLCRAALLVLALQPIYLLAWLQPIMWPPSNYDVSE